VVGDTLQEVMLETAGNQAPQTDTTKGHTDVAAPVRRLLVDKPGSPQS
jgi:hypothetical protein